MIAFFRLPSFRFVAVALLGLVIFALTILTVLNQPRIDVPTGAQIEAVDGIAVLLTDTIEEPDQLGTFADMQAFFDRQTAFFDKFQADTVAVTYRNAQGATVSETREIRSSGLNDLPFVFWFQNLVGLIAVFVGGWVFSLRRGAAAISLVLLGLGLQISASAASIYGSRQLALPGDFFQTVSSVNHLGAAIFGTALVTLFMSFPRQLVHPKWMVIPVIVFTLFHLSDTYHWTASPSYSIAILLQLLIAIGFGIAQWRLSRGEPLDRAGLRWFSMFTFTGCVLFTAVSILPPTLGLSDTGLVSQGYAFGFLATIHIGLALGVARFRLFSLDRFTYYMWIWLGGAALIFALDFALLYWMQSQPWASLALALFVGSFLYFPLRQFLIARLLTRKSASIVGKIPEMVSVGLAPSQFLRLEAWDALLRETFQPANAIEQLDMVFETPRLSDEGLSLDIPPTRDLPGRRLRYGDLGRRLFTHADLDVVGTLMHVYGTVLDSREAYESGVSEERGRIARDVHDNIGAQLLNALHTEGDGRKDAMLRDTLTDLRTIVNEGFQTRVSLDHILYDMRHELGDRVEVYGIALNWPISEMPQVEDLSVAYEFANAMRSILREATSNTIKYAQASQISVTARVDGQGLELVFSDNGQGFDLGSAVMGNGVKNTQDRAIKLGGTAQFTSDANGTVLRLNLPFDDTKPAA